MRVVSLLPSATEICYALGIEPVGVSHECDYPPSAESLPSVNRSRVSNTGSSAAINEQVAAAEMAGGVYEIDRGALAAADPDLVIAQAVCDVCAIDESVAREAVADLGLDAEVLTLHSHALEGVLDDVRRIGAATGRAAEAADLVDALRTRIEEVRSTASAAESRPRVAVLDWMDPVMVAGHWVPEMVAIAGGEYGLAEPGDRSSPREWAAIVEYDPEVLVVAPCGFELPRTVEHAVELTTRDGWDDVTAVRTERAFAMDGHHYVNRPGPRLVDTLEHLAGVIHPARFEPPPPDVATELSVRRAAE